MKSPAMNASAVLEYLLAGFPDLQRVQTGSETGLFYNESYVRPRGVCFASLKERNGLRDIASGLDRAGVFRLSLHAGETWFRKHFGALPARSAPVVWPHDPGALNVLLPHPVYAWLGWVCVLNPEAETLRRLQPVLETAYRLARARHQRKFVHA